MSQKKIDARKQSKGDLLHNAKKQYKITVATVAGVLVVLGALVSVITYHSGYDKGEGKGKKDGYELGSMYESIYSAQQASKEAASKEAASKEQASKDNKETTSATEETTTAQETTAAK